MIDGKKMLLFAAIGLGMRYAAQHGAKTAAAAVAPPPVAAPGGGRDVTNDLSYGSSTYPLLADAPPTSFLFLNRLAQWSAAQLTVEPMTPFRGPKPGGVGTSLDYPRSFQ
jgi:hypothetical protein